MALTPWRDVVAPQPDVRARRPREDQFMVNLAAVLSGDAEPEYRAPVTFFERTYVTAGMRDLLAAVLTRLTGGDAPPVIQLKTAFGGGKTHSLLALYHAVRAPGPIGQAGLWPRGLPVAADAVPPVRVAVLPCPAFDVTRPRHYPALPGQPVRTLWGELAWRLLGPEGYALVAAADAQGVAPGGATLVTLLRAASPCLILVDEIVAYVRNLYRVAAIPPSGSFDAQLTFVHNLTEAVQQVRDAALVATLPASDVELGGEGGEAALERLEPIFGRVETVWRPVAVEEAFAVVRRRLFGAVADPAAQAATCQAFWDYYRRHRDLFPPEAREARYRERLEEAYPLHPELFDRLYAEWSTLDGFQRTRGVLRLLAGAVHTLWAATDPAPLILPGTLPLDDDYVRAELTKPLPESEAWHTVLETDIDGPRSAAYRLDAEVLRYGQVQAARRLARALFFETAPAAAGAGLRGVDWPRLRLATLMPGDTPGLFRDALTQLQQTRTSYVHRAAEPGDPDSERYWVDLRQSLERVADQRAEELVRERIRVDAHLVGLLRERVAAARGVPAQVIDQAEALAASADVPDGGREAEGVRLLVLHPAHGWRGVHSPAREAAETLVRQHGPDPRRWQTRLVCLAPLGDEVGNLRRQAARWLAWDSILRDARVLNLDAYQHDEAERAREAQAQAVAQALAQTYRVLLAPAQTPEEAQAQPPTLHWDAVTLPPAPDPIRAAWQRAVADEWVRTAFDPRFLALALAQWFWPQGPAVAVPALWDAFCRYLYLPRLQHADVFRASVIAGVEAGLFAWAAEADPAAGRYAGVVRGTAPPALAEGLAGWLVQPDAVAPDLSGAGPGPGPADPGAAGAAGPGPTTRPGGFPVPPPPPGPPPSPGPRAVVVTAAWHGPDAYRLASRVGTIQEEILGALLGSPSVAVDAELVVRVRSPEGWPADRLRAALENARTLGCDITVEE
ncbi:MAG: DUF499 domain-containing protein [Actinomycetia bacterium]|nr:DUF499 domain-containing protein [Actinomycetes bacterium]